MPSMALPTAAVGAAGASFIVLFLTGSWAAARSAFDPSVPPIAGGLVGLGLGAVLDRWRERSTEAIGATLGRVLPALFVAGGLVGTVLAFASSLEWWRTWIIMPGAAVYALLFAPSCLVIMRASARASRARLGSLVAAADRQTVASTTAAAIAVSSLPAAFAHPMRAPLALGLMASVTVGAAYAVLGLLLRDRSLARRLDALASQDLEPGAPGDDARRAAVDVGLGAGTWTAPHRTPGYRAASRGELLLRGDIDAARTALRGERNRRLRTLAVIVGVLPVAALSWTTASATSP